MLEGEDSAGNLFIKANLTAIWLPRLCGSRDSKALWLPGLLGPKPPGS